MENYGAFIITAMVFFPKGCVGTATTFDKVYKKVYSPFTIKAEQNHIDGYELEFCAKYLDFSGHDYFIDFKVI